MSLRPMEDELQALEDNLEKVQAQLQSVLSAPNVDQTAITEIIHKVEVLCWFTTLWSLFWIEY